MKTINGYLDAVYDDDGLYVILVFARRKDGEVWDARRLKTLLKSKSIVHGYTDKDVGKAILYFYQNEDKERYNLINLFPSNLWGKVFWEKSEETEIDEELIQKIVKYTTPPIFYKEKPFAERKRDGVTNENEAEEKKEKIFTDPVAKSAWYVKKNALIGIYQPSITAQSAVNIFGASIQVQPRRFIFGDNIRDSDMRVYSTIDGIVRIGTNWADVIRYSKNHYDFHISADRSSFLVTFKPGENDPDVPSYDDILVKAKEIEYNAADLRSREDIEGIVSRIHHENAPVIDFPLCIDEDSSYSVDIAEDNQSAYLSVKKGKGNGKPLKLKDTGKAILDSGLKRIDTNRIKEDLVSFFRSNETVLHRYVLSQGKLPTKGEKRLFSFAADFMKNEDMKKVVGNIRKFLEKKEGVSAEEKARTEKTEKCAFVAKDEIIGSFSPPVFGEDGLDVFGKVLRGLPGDQPELMLYENVHQNKDDLVSELDGILEIFTVEDRIHLNIRPYRDSRIDINVSADGMKASISLFREIGAGVPLSFDDIKKEITKRNIVKGMKNEVLSKAFEKACTDGEIRDIIFAEGVLPSTGNPPRLDFIITLASGKKVYEKSNGKVDFRRQDRLTHVKKGDTIAEVITQDTEGKDGWNIFGKELKGQKEGVLSLELGSNVIEKKVQGRTFLYADAGGYIKYDKKSISIEPEYYIKGDVDYSTGSIKFPGVVKVKGSVIDGFYIMASDDVYIGANVDKALVSSLKSIYIANGVKGGGKAVIRANEKLYTNFIEQTTLLVVGDIHIKKSCLHSKIKSNGKLVINGDGSVVIGGNICVRQGIDARNLGSERGVKTYISFGQDYLIADQIDVEEKEVKTLKEAIAKIDIIMKKVEIEGARDKLAIARKQKLDSMKELEKRSVRLFTLREKFEEYHPSEIKVHGTLYPGVVIESHGRFFEVTTVKNNVILSFNAESGRIQERVLGKPHE